MEDWVDLVGWLYTKMVHLFRRQPPILVLTAPGDDDDDDDDDKRMNFNVA